MRLCTSTAIDCSGSRLRSAARISTTRSASAPRRVATTGADRDELLRGALANCAAGAERGGAALDAVFGRKHAGENRVDPVDDRRRAAEVALEREARQGDAADAELLRTQEQRHVRVAKAVDRLHRVADEKQRAAVVALPAGGQQLEQSQLRLRGVLELVDENVLDSAIECQQQIGRRLDLAQRAARRERELHEIDGAPLGEYDLELRRETQQHGPQRREAAPLRIAVMPLGQRRDGRERLP